MSTKDANLGIDESFFNALFPLAYPGVCEKTLQVARDMLSDGVIQIETLLELAISKVGRIKRRSVEGMDFADGSDAKKSTVRTSTYERAYSAPISKVHAKKGLLRVMVYERKRDRFYYFVFPHESYRHIKASSNIDIPFELDGTPRRIPMRSVMVNWWSYEVDSFDRMSKAKKATQVTTSVLYDKIRAERAARLASGEAR